MPSPGDRFRDDVKALVERVIRELGLEERFRVVTEYPSPHGSVIREQGRKVDVAVLEREGVGRISFWSANGNRAQVVRRISFFAQPRRRSVIAFLAFTPWSFLEVRVSEPRCAVGR